MPIWSPKSRTIGAESIIPPGVGSIPIIIGIAASAKRRLLNMPSIADTKRCDTPVSFIASPSTLTKITSAVSVMQRYPVVWLKGLLRHSSAAVRQNSPGVTLKSIAITTDDRSIARPSLTLSLSSTTRKTSAKAIAISAYIYHILSEKVDRCFVNNSPVSVKRIILLFVLLGGFCPGGFVRAEVFEVTPVMETRPVSHSGDSADDARVWVHPTDPNKSVIIGTDKDDDGGLAVYDLAGNRLSFTAGGRMNNIDIRYNFPLATGKVDIIAVGNRTNDSIAVYTIDPNGLELSDIAARTISIGIEEAYGFCLYHSWRTNKHYAFVNDKNGQVEQWALFGDQNGKVDAVRVRAFDVGGQTEGMTADDQLVCPET